VRLSSAKLFIQSFLEACHKGDTALRRYAVHYPDVEVVKGHSMMEDFNLRSQSLSQC